MVSVQTGEGNEEGVFIRLSFNDEKAREACSSAMEIVEIECSRRKSASFVRAQIVNNVTSSSDEGGELDYGLREKDAKLLKIGKKTTLFTYTQETEDSEPEENAGVLEGEQPEH